jgi:hypothetical protein
MKQKMKSLIKRLSTIIDKNERWHNKVPSHVTKEEMLRIFVKELPEPSPRHEAWQNA